MTTIEKIKVAEKRILELELLINYWKLNSIENDQKELKLLKHEASEENLAIAA